MIVSPSVRGAWIGNGHEKSTLRSAKCFFVCGFMRPLSFSLATLRGLRSGSFRLLRRDNRDAKIEGCHPPNRKQCKYQTHAPLLPNLPRNKGKGLNFHAFPLCRSPFPLIPCFVLYHVFPFLAMDFRFCTDRSFVTLRVGSVD